MVARLPDMPTMAFDKPIPSPRCCGKFDATVGMTERSVMSAAWPCKLAATTNNHHGHGEARCVEGESSAHINPQPRTPMVPPASTVADGPTRS